MSGITLNGIFENPSMLAASFQCLIPYRLDAKTIALTSKNWNQAVVKAEKDENYEKIRSLIRYIIKNLKIKENLELVRSFKACPEGNSLFEVQVSTLKKTVQIALLVHNFLYEETKLIKRRLYKDSPHIFKSIIEADFFPIIKHAEKYNPLLKPFLQDLLTRNKINKQDAEQFNFVTKKFIMTGCIGNVNISEEPLIKELNDFYFVNAPFLTPSDRNILIHDVFIRTVNLDRYCNLAILQQNFKAFRDLFLDSSHWINYLDKASCNYLKRGDSRTSTMLKKCVDLGTRVNQTLNIPTLKKTSSSEIGESEFATQTKTMLQYAKMNCSMHSNATQKTFDESEGDEYVRQEKSILQREGIKVPAQSSANRKSSNQAREDANARHTRGILLAACGIEVPVQPSVNQKILDDLEIKFQMYLMPQYEGDELFIGEAFDLLSGVNEIAKNTFFYNLINAIVNTKTTDEFILSKAELIVQTFISNEDTNNKCLVMINSLRATTPAKNPSIYGVIAKNVNALTAPIPKAKSEPSIKELITDKLYSKALEKINFLSDTTERRFALYNLANAIGAFDNVALDPYNDIRDASVRLYVLKFYFTMLENKAFKTKKLNSKTRQETLKVLNLITDETIRTTIFENLTKFFFPELENSLSMLRGLEEPSARLIVLKFYFTVLENKAFELRKLDSKTRRDIFKTLNLITDETIRTNLFTNLARFFFPDHTNDIIMLSSLEEPNERLELLNELF